MFTKLRHKTIWKAFFSGQLKLRGWGISPRWAPVTFWRHIFRCIFPPHNCIWWIFATPSDECERKQQKERKNNPH